MTEIFTTLSPKWNLPHVKAFTILASAADLSPVSFGHDDASAALCRQKLEEVVKPNQPICWLRQVHGNRVVELPVASDQKWGVDGSCFVEADGSFTLQKAMVCAVLTADCLPLVFTNLSGSRVGVVHAGRKGLEKTIIAEMIRRLETSAAELLVWIGPGIAAESYPISKEIRDEVIALSASYETVFKEGKEGQLLMNLYEMARMQLDGLGVLPNHISGAAWNTFTENRFHSARRDKERSGRMATVVWME